jgi:hypothetical protein
MAMAMTPLQIRQKQYAQFLIAGCPRLGIPGLHAVSASAIVGNATQENQVQPITSGAKDHGSDGTMQWRLGRLTDMEDWCTENFGTWKTLEAQAAYTVMSCKRDYPNLWADLEEAAKSIETLTADFCDIYESPAKSTENLEGRIAAANSTRVLLLMPNIPGPAKPNGVLPKPPVMPPNVARNTGTATAAVVAGGAVAAHTAGAPWWVVGALSVIAMGSIGAVILNEMNQNKRMAVPVEPAPSTPPPPQRLPPTPTVFPTPPIIPPGRPPETTPNPMEPNPTPFPPAPTPTITSQPKQTAFPPKGETK